MKTKLLRKIKRNAYITRLGNGLYKAEIKSGWFWSGASCKTTTKEQAEKNIKELIIFVANFNFTRKGNLFYFL
jgi:hypothetical protein